MEVDPQLNNVITGCARAFDSDIKEHLNCSFMGQHGRYVTNINMPVDGTVVTLDDWHDLTNAIQNRMIIQVEKDRENLTNKHSSLRQHTLGTRKSYENHQINFNRFT